MMNFKIFSRRGLKGKRWYFRARADGNNRIVLQSEGYRNHADCRSTVYLIRREAGESKIDDSEYESSRS